MRKMVDVGGGAKLKIEDIRHYQRTVVALGETGRLMKSRCLVEMFEDKSGK